MERTTHFTKFDHYDSVGLPFKMRINFMPIIAYYESLLESDTEAKRIFARKQLESIENTPRLREPFDNFDELYEYEEEIHHLLDLFFPEILTTNEIKGAVMPYVPFFFRTTKRLDAIFENAGDDYEFIPRQFDSGHMYILACIFALNTLYGANLNTTFPIYFDIPNKKTGVLKRYRALHNADFASFSLLNKDLNITAADIRELADNLHDLDLWKKKLPPKSFEFNGFGLVTLVDLTMDDALSSMKNILLQKNALFSEEKIDLLELQLRDYFGESDLHLGLARYHKDKDTVSILRDNKTRCLLMEGKERLDKDDCFCNSSTDIIFKQKAPLIAHDIDSIDGDLSPLLAMYKDSGVKSAMVMPLLYGDEIIGILELTSLKVGILNSLAASKMQDVLPLFAVALQRAIDEEQTQVEAIVQEKFTSIHPTVSWRFFDIAENHLRSGRGEEVDLSDDIVFNDVIPLYGQFDIRGSSAARNQAIQADLGKQLKLASNVLEEAIKLQDYPIYKALNFRINRYRNGLESGMHAGDEVSILEFLTSEVYPAFNHMAESRDHLRKLVESYTTALDQRLGVIYELRKDYENSVTRINEELSLLVDKHQEAAQKLIPHYFEKYKTDGVEYNAYIGQSLLMGQSYNPIHLQNLQLWQLLMTIEAEHLVKSIQPRLENALDITSLILVHTSPPSIRFRMDEKKFDVDGAYNIRYEIVKKRIDKAHIKGTTERLTQPGKIAVVYTQDKESDDYLKYFEYLQSEQLIKPGIEHHELEDLQGTAGLKAMRVEVDFDNAKSAEVLRNQLEEVMSADV